uniref:Uncharacterized protein n=1 Tax=Triticum urartu TaxID=4572 RepID=A0A8R7V993_TRIUA
MSSARTYCSIRSMRHTWLIFGWPS